MLRSSSTPILGSLLQSFSESPNNNSNLHHSELHGYGSTHKNTPNSIQCKLSCANGGSQNVKKSFFHSPSLAESTSKNGFRRVQSEGNLDELVGNDNEFSLSKRSGGRRNSCSTLEAIPSFSVHHQGTPFDDSDDEECEEFEHEEICGKLEMVHISKPVSVNGYGDLKIEGEGKMYLATGLGFSGVDFVDDCGNSGGRGGGYRPVAFDREGGDSHGISMEEYYKKMLQENPGDPLFLRNYAQFLYQKKGELEGAEEYYSRAILADPGDGEILSQYAKLIWELHHDKDRAAKYFERAIQASTENSHIQAAYASFLWDTEDEDENEEDEERNYQIGHPVFHHGFVASAATA